MRPLTAQQLAFIEAYLTEPTGNATKAYESVYRARGDVAGAAAARLLADVRLRKIIDERRAETAERSKLKIDDVVRHITEIIEADPRDLTEYRRGACRYCYGAEHLYQRTPRELRDDYKAFEANRHKAGAPQVFDMQGGTGYTPKRDPHPDCPECYGDGVGYEYFKDTRKLSKNAARLYAGVKVTKNGLEIQTRSQDAAVKMLGEHLGAFVKRHEVTGKDGKPIASVSATVTAPLPADPIEAAQLYAQLIKG